MNLKQCLSAATPLLAAFNLQAAPPLPALNIDKSQTSVSGVSSGGYMAVQLHVAYSGVFKKGAGVIAGGPYNCAESSVLNAISRCLGKAAIPVADLTKITNAWAKEGAIDPVANLTASKVYLFSGSKDSVVGQSTSTDLQAYYQNFMPAANIVLKKDIEAEHAVITDDYGATCMTKAAPFINNCGFDTAGALLQFLYGTLSPRNKGDATGTLSEFDQTPFVNGHGMAATGWVYVPKTCSAGASCRVHVALHGCKQNTGDVNQEFVAHAGYNKWADTNNIVVLYPQTGGKAVNSCWDWWGYDDPNYAKKSAPQMSAIVGMIEQLFAPAKKTALLSFPTPPSAGAR